MPTIRVLHFGLGPIGASIVKQISQRPGFKIVGAIDIDPAKVGRDLGDVAGLKKRLGVQGVQTDAAKALKATKPDVVVHCTSSSLERVMPQLETILEVESARSSRRPRSWRIPFSTHTRQAQAARRAGEEGEGRRARHRRQSRASRWTRCRLPSRAVCERVDRVVVNRIQDARIRRLPFQQKIGAGLTTEQFRRR